MVHPYLEYYSAIKRNELSIHTTTWVNLYRIMLSRNSHFPKGYIRLHILWFHLYKTWNDKIIDIEITLVISRGGNTEMGGVGSERVNKRALEGPLGWWKCSASWLCQQQWWCRFVRRNHWLTQTKGHMGSLSTISHNFMWIYNYFKIRKII